MDAVVGERGARVTAHPSTEAQTPLGRGLTVLGDRWTLLILRRMFIEHERRYGQLRDSLGVADSVLAARLVEMVDAGLIERREVDGRPEYWVAERGLALWKFLVAMWAWEREWSHVEPATLHGLEHSTCGHPTLPRLGCPACGEVVRARDLETILGPEGRMDLAAPPRGRRRSSKQEVADEGVFRFETLMLIGDRWSVVLFCAILLGARGFTELQRTVGISPTVLSDRLRRLELAGVVVREPVGGSRVHYRLTPKGVAFFGVLTLMADWARRWPDAATRDDGADIVEFRHRTCGHAITPVLLCDHCGDPLERRAVRWTPPTAD